jgi:DNA polymerase III epsilon subunit-like protein
MYLFIDTETTGITPRDRIVSLCWAVYDLDGRKSSSTYVLIQPDGFTIPPSATAIHGITTEIARAQGIALGAALDALSREVSQAQPRLLIGHNIDFDRPKILGEFARVRRPENLSALPTFCTMKTTTQVCRIPGRYGDYKWPKLEELHHTLFGAVHGTAHNAEADVNACARCFFELQARGLAPRV